MAMLLAIAVLAQHLWRAKADLQTLTLTGGRTALVARHAAGPTLLVLDGAGHKAATFAVDSGFAAAARRFDFAAAFAESRDGVWRYKNLGYTDDRSDENYVVDLRNRLVADGSAPDRMYLVGFSNGGALAFQVACAYPDLFAGVAVVSSAMPAAVGETCSRLPSSIVVVIGTADPIFPVDGVVSPSWGRTWSADRLVDFLEYDRKCRTRSERSLSFDWSAAARHVILLETEGCERSGVGRIYKVEGGDHDFYNETYWRRLFRPRGLFLAPEIIVEAFSAGT